LDEEEELDDEEDLDGEEELDEEEELDDEAQVEETQRFNLELGTTQEEVDQVILELLLAGTMSFRTSTRSFLKGTTHLSYFARLDILPDSISHCLEELSNFRQNHSPIRLQFVAGLTAGDV
jgi:hypothetical protein